PRLLALPRSTLFPYTTLFRSPMFGLKIFEFDPDKGFEAFTVAIYNRITEEGRNAFYVFDSLSSLQSVWYTDLMMGNFFRLTCPRSEEHTSELQSRFDLVCRLL